MSISRLSDADQLELDTKTIDELDVGDIVQGCDGYAEVKECVHGNRYYAYIGDWQELCTSRGYAEDHDDDYVRVSDSDDLSLECCA